MMKIRELNGMAVQIYVSTATDTFTENLCVSLPQIKFDNNYFIEIAGCFQMDNVSFQILLTYANDLRSIPLVLVTFIGDNPCNFFSSRNASLSVCERWHFTHQDASRMQHFRGCRRIQGNLTRLHSFSI